MTDGVWAPLRAALGVRKERRGRKPKLQATRGPKPLPKQKPKKMGTKQSVEQVIKELKKDPMKNKIDVYIRKKANAYIQKHSKPLEATGLGTLKGPAAAGTIAGVTQMLVNIVNGAKDKDAIFKKPFNYMATLNKLSGADKKLLADLTVEYPTLRNSDFQQYFTAMLHIDRKEAMKLLNPLKDNPVGTDIARDHMQKIIIRFFKGNRAKLWDGVADGIATASVSYSLRDLAKKKYFEWTTDYTPSPVIGKGKKKKVLKKKSRMRPAEDKGEKKSVMLMAFFFS